MRIHSQRPTVVIGFGNLLLSDEGIGVHLVRALAARADRFPDADFRELGTGGMTMLHVIAGRRKAVLLDCARMGESPGAIRRFTPDHVATLKTASRFSLHAGDLLDILALARQLGECPGMVVIYGIQPASLELGEGLSATLAARCEDYLRSISEELAQPAAG